MALVNNPLAITIGVAPTDGLDLTREVQMVKAALMYGDRVTLCSVRTYFFAIIDAIGAAKGAERLSILEELVPVLRRDDPQAQEAALAGLHALRQLRAIKHPSGPIIIAKRKAERAIADAWDQLQEEILTILTDAGADELIPAMKSGLLQLHQFDMSKGMDSVVHEFFDAVGQKTIDNQAYPLLDADTADLVSAAIKEGKLVIDQSTTNRSKQIGLATDMFGRLPVFPNASMSAILDIRSEIEKPLVRFRAGVMEVAEKLPSAAWDANFNADVEQLIRRVVEPAILEIEEAVKMNSTLRSLVRTAADKATMSDILSPAIGLGVANMLGIPAWIGATVGAGTIVYKAWEDIRKKQRESEKHWLYFYYRIGSDLQQP